MENAELAAVEINRANAALIVGRAVDGRALDALFAKWPTAIVRVSHHVEPPAPIEERDKRQTTTVKIESPEQNYMVFGQAVCAPGDEWDRKKGIAIAFKRAKEKVDARVRYIEHQRVLSGA